MTFWSIKVYSARSQSASEIKGEICSVKREMHRPFTVSVSLGKMILRLLGTGPGSIAGIQSNVSVTNRPANSRADEGCMYGEWW